MRVWAQFSHRSTWPPSARVRQISMAVMTRRWARLRCPSLATRQHAPCLRKMSASSSFGSNTTDASASGILHVQEFERTLNLSDSVDRHARIFCRRRYVTMAQQILNDANIDALLQEMGGKTM